MKEKLLERLKELDVLINSQTSSVHQANADLNALHGHRRELNYVLQLLEEGSKDEKEPCSLSECDTEHNGVSCEAV